MNKQQLAQKIWASANQMRSKIEANEYKDYILGFIFYKYLSDKEVSFLKENDYNDEYMKTVTEDDPETVKWVQENIGYFISYENLFSTWLELGRDFDVSNVRDALSAFSRLISNTHKRVFDKVFDTLQTGLSKLGDSSGTQTKAISGLLQLIKDIPMDGKQGYDVLGFIYEYLISMFAANAGKKAGEFYTPHEVSLLMSEIVASHLKGKNEIKIYDPTSGSGSLLINIGQSVAKYMSDSDNIKYYAQELKENTYNLTRMNLVMRGIKPDNIVTRNGDTLEEDWPFFDENDPVNTYDPLYVDAVVSNPPYSQNWSPENKEHDVRYARYGLAPKSKADYAFLLHDLYHIKPDGIMTIVLPHGVLFRGGEEGIIRKNLIENNNIDAIIGLPANIFFGTGIPTIIMVLRQKRENTDVLIIDASKGFVKEGKNNKLRASDIKRITDTFVDRKDVHKFSRVVSREEIRENDYNLNIPRYVDSSEETEHWDIYATMFGGIPKSELDTMEEVWKAFPNLRKELFIDNGRLVFIVDEAHRSTFGDMLTTIKETFPNAIFFGFTGTPIFDENARKKSAQTDVFGNELHRYSIADGIRDKNVLGFDPYKVLTFRDKDVRRAVALEKAKSHTEEEAISDPKKAEIYYKYMDDSQVKMAGEMGNDGKWIKGIEDFIPQSQYHSKEHQEKVVEDIKENWVRLSHNGKFHAIFATSSIPEAIEYYRLIKERIPTLKTTCLFDPNIDNNGGVVFKEDGLIEIISDYNTQYGMDYNIPTHAKFKKDIALRLAHKEQYKRIEREPQKQFEGGGEGGRNEDVPYDLVGYLIEIDTGRIDSDYMNSRFEKYLKLIKQEGIPGELIEQARAELHKTFAGLTQEEQKYANIFLHDTERGDVIPEPGKTLRDYITEYLYTAKDDQIHHFATAFGMDEEKLRDMMSLGLTEANINEFGRFDELRKSVDKEKAKKFLEAYEHTKLIPPKVNMKTDQLLRKFILSGGFEVNMPE